MARRELDVLREWWSVHQLDEYPLFCNCSGDFQEKLEVFLHKLDLKTVRCSDLFTGVLSGECGCKNYFKLQFVKEIMEFIAAMSHKSLHRDKDFKKFVRRYREIKKSIITDAFFRAYFVTKIRLGVDVYDELNEIIITMSNAAKLRIAEMKLPTQLKGKQLTKADRLTYMDKLLGNISNYINAQRTSMSKEQLALMVQAAPLWIFLSLNLPKNEITKAWDYILAAYSYSFSSELIMNWPENKASDYLKKSRRQFLFYERDIEADFTLETTLMSVYC